MGQATTPQLPSSSTTGISLTSPDGTPISWLGVGDDGAFVIDTVDGPKPPKPSVPTVSADAGLLRIDWDGNFADSDGDIAVLPSGDVDRVEVHASQDENFVPDRVLSFGGAFSTMDGGSFTLGPLESAGTWYIRLVARSTSNQYSEPSERVEQELALTDIDLAINDAWMTGLTASITADGKNSIYRGADAPAEDPDDPFKDGDIWFEMTEDGKSIPNIWDDTLGEWTGNDDFRQSEIERVQTELREDLDAIVVGEGGTKNFYRGTMPTDEESSEGDLWFNSADKNIPYIYQDGEWITVASSFNTPGAGEDILTLTTPESTTKNAVDNQWSNVTGFTGVPESTGLVATVPSGATGVATIRFPLTGSFDASGDWIIPDADFIKPNGLGVGMSGTIDILSPDFTPTARVVLKYDLTGTSGEIFINLAVQDSSFGSIRTHRVDMKAQDKALLGLYPTLVPWSIFLEVSIGSTAGNNATVAATFPYVVGDKGIADKAITTDKIAVGAITAESGIIGSINAGTITVGEMNGARIKAQTIAADKMLVGGDRNLVSNGELEAGNANGWPTAGSYQTTDTPPGKASAVTFPAGQGTVSGRAMGSDYQISSGDTLVFEAWIKADTAGSVFFMEVRDQGGAHLSTSSGNNWVNLEGGSTHNSYPVGAWTVPTAWTKVVSTLKIGGSVTGFHFGGWFFNHSTGTNRNASVSISGVKLYKQVGATLIQDGSIITSKIAVGAITADSGIIGSIDANVITVGKIMANQLHADAINGKTITGATIRTASSGSRVELTQNGLKQYNSLGAVVTDMSLGSFTLNGGTITGSTIKTAATGSRVEVTSTGLKQYDAANQVVTDLSGSGALLAGNLVVSANALVTGALRVQGGTDPSLGQVEMTLSRDFQDRPAIVFDAKAVNGAPAWHSSAYLSAERTSGQNRILLVGPGKPNVPAGQAGMVSLEDTNWFVGLAGQGGIRSSYVYGRVSDPSDSVGSATIAGGSARLELNSDPGRVQSMTVVNTNVGTGSNTQALRISTTTGSLGVGSSSIRYKQSVEDASTLDAILDIRTRTWLYKSDVEQSNQLAAFREEQGEGPIPRQLGEASDTPSRSYGAIAEEVDELGLSDLVAYDQYGRPDALQYEMFGVALIPIVRGLRDRIEQLETQLASA